MAGLGKLMEVKRDWTIDDLFDAHDLLDMRDAADADAMRNMRAST